MEGKKGLPPEAAGRAVKEYMAMLDDEAFGGCLRPMSCPSSSHRADPAARWTGAHGGQAFFAYSTNYLIDVDNAIIVDVEDHNRDPAGRGPSRKAHDRTLDRSLRSLSPHASWGTAPTAQPQMLGWLVYEHGIEPHVTLPCFR